MPNYAHDPNRRHDFDALGLRGRILDTYNGIYIYSGRLNPNFGVGFGAQTLNTPIDTTPSPVPEDKLNSWFEGIVPIQAEQARRWREVAKDRRTYLWLSILLNVALTCTIMAMVPNTQIVPVFMFNGPDGLQVMSSTISDLPPSQEVASIEARLWTYLHLRESYNSVEADENYKIVSAMSDDTVRNQYQTWANAKKNKLAPANLLGRDGWIRIFKVSSAFITHEGDYAGGVYRINYCKVTYGGQAETMRAQPMSEVIAYHLARRIPFLQRTTFNPEAVVVTQYPGPEELSSPRDVNLGSLNPCGILR